MKFLKSIIVACVLSASCGAAWAMDTKETEQKDQEHIDTFMHEAQLAVIRTVPSKDLSKSAETQYFDSKKFANNFSKEADCEGSLAKVFHDTLHNIREDKAIDTLYHGDTNKFQALVIKLLVKIENILLQWAKSLHRLGVTWGQVEATLQDCFKTLEQESKDFLVGKGLNDHMAPVSKKIVEILAKTKLLIMGLKIEMPEDEDGEDADEDDVKSASAKKSKQLLKGNRLGGKAVCLMYASLLALWQGLSWAVDAEPVALTNVPLHAATLLMSTFLTATWNGFKYGEI